LPIQLGGYTVRGIPSWLSRSIGPYSGSRVSVGTCHPETYMALPMLLIVPDVPDVFSSCNIPTLYLTTCVRVLLSLWIVCSCPEEVSFPTAVASSVQFLCPLGLETFLSFSLPLNLLDSLLYLVLQLSFLLLCNLLDFFLFYSWPSSHACVCMHIILMPYVSSPESSLKHI